MRTVSIIFVLLYLSMALTNDAEEPHSRRVGITSSDGTKTLQITREKRDVFADILKIKPPQNNNKEQKRKQFEAKKAENQRKAATIKAIRKRTEEAKKRFEAKKRRNQEIREKQQKAREHKKEIRQKRQERIKQQREKRKERRREMNKKRVEAIKKLQARING